jgi:hypothetical protein
VASDRTFYYIPGAGLRIASVADLPGAVSFLSDTGAVYTLQHRADLLAGGWSNAPGAGPLQGTGGTLTLTDTNPPVGPQRFYRVTYSTVP